LLKVCFSQIEEKKQKQSLQLNNTEISEIYHKPISEH